MNKSSFKVNALITLSLLMFSNVSCTNSLVNQNTISSVNSQNIKTKYLLEGRAQFPENKNLKILSEVEKVSVGSTVSIISSDGQTIATSLTDDNGYFKINIYSNFNPTVG